MKHLTVGHAPSQGCSSLPGTRKPGHCSDSHAWHAMVWPSRVPYGVTVRLLADTPVFGPSTWAVIGHQNGKVMQQWQVLHQAHPKPVLHGAGRQSCHCLLLLQARPSHWPICCRVCTACRVQQPTRYCELRLSLIACGGMLHTVPIVSTMCRLVPIVPALCPCCLRFWL